MTRFRTDQAPEAGRKGQPEECPEYSIREGLETGTIVQEETPIVEVSHGTLGRIAMIESLEDDRPDNPSLFEITLADPNLHRVLDTERMSNIAMQQRRYPVVKDKK